MLLEEIFQMEFLQTAGDAKKASKYKTQIHNTEIQVEFNAQPTEVY